MLIRYDNVMIMRCREANGMILVLVLYSLSVFYNDNDMLIRYDNVMIMRCREANGMIVVLVLYSLSVFYIFPFNSYFKQIYDDDDEWNGSISH